MSTAPSTTLTRANLSEEQLVSAAIVSVIALSIGFFTTSTPIAGVVSLSFIVSGGILYGILSAFNVTSRTRMRVALGTSILGIATAGATLAIGLVPAVILSVAFALLAVIQIQIAL